MKIGTRRPLICTVLVLWCVLTLTALPVMAQEAAEDKSDESVEEGRHELGAFLGISIKEDDSGISVGVDYEYRLSRLFGIGAVAEYTGADFREGLLGVPFYWHAWRELKLVAAPAVEIEPAERSGWFVVRLGGEYGFPVRPGVDIAPALYIDLSSEDVAVVVGASVATGF